MDRSPMRQELSAALSPFRTRVESCNHEALAWLVRQAEEAQTTPARPVPGNVPDLEHLDRYTYDVLGARVRSIEHRTSSPLDCTRSLCMQSCLTECRNEKQLRTMCLAVSAAENHFGSGSSEPVLKIGKQGCAKHSGPPNPVVSEGAAGPRPWCP
ncbi:hypothetical protein MCOR02_005951 [Pyricularia oryzae]|nr:hypothetical protein MCOR02_005951 [Pyricularia oryzae]